MKSTKSANINLTETLSLKTYIAEDGNHYVSAIELNENIGFQAGQMGLGKSLKRIVGKDFKLGKIKPEGTVQNVTGIPLSTVELLLAKLAFGGNELAQQVVIALAGTTLQLLSDDAHGIEITNARVKATYEARMQHKRSYHPLFTRWVKADNEDYIKRLSQFKKACGLPGNLSVEDMDKEALDKINTGELLYDKARAKGMSHAEALEFIK